MTKITKRDKGMIVCGYALLLDSLFILGLFITMIAQGSLAKLPAQKSTEVVLVVCFGGLSMLFISYYLLKQEYEKPKLEKVE